MFIDDVLLAILVVLAIGAVRSRDLLAATGIAGAYSLMMALLWVRMNAVDVAFTEAAVGAGISTVLMLAAISRVGRLEKLPKVVPSDDERGARRRRVLQGTPFVACVLCAGALIYGTADMPRVGDAEAPANIHPDVAVRYLDSADKADGTLGEIGPVNVVTSVLGDYRGYDTLGETTVIFTAALCVVLLLRHGHGTGGAPAESGVPGRIAPALLGGPRRRSGGKGKGKGKGGRG